MPSPVPKGNEGIKWTPPGGTEQTHTFQWPPFIVSYRERKRRWTHQRDNIEKPHTWILNVAVGEITLRVRIEPNADDMLDLLADGADGVQLDYYTDLADATTKHPSNLVGVQETVEVQQDDGRLSHAEYEVRQVTLRHADGGDYRDLL